MKTVLRNILLVTVMLGTFTTSYASGALNIASTINHVKKGDYISVTDTKGQVVYSGRINYSGNLANLFDFRQLEDGIYTIEVNKDFVIEMNSIQVKNNNVIFLESSKQEIFKPVFRAEDSKVLISKLAIDTDEMTVELYYENELIFTETVKGEDILNRVYKLDDTLEGNYSAIIRSNDRVFIENFEI